MWVLFRTINYLLNPCGFIYPISTKPTELNRISYRYQMIMCSESSLHPSSVQLFLLYFQNTSISSSVFKPLGGDSYPP